MPNPSIAAGTLAALLAAMPATAQVGEQAYRGGRIGDLAAICAASDTDAVARGRCHGFLVAAGRCHRSATAHGSHNPPLFCLPEPAPTLDQVRGAFVAWARANPQFAETGTVDGLMRFAAAAWPCRPRRHRPAGGAGLQRTDPCARSRGLPLPFWASASPAVPT